MCRLKYFCHNKTCTRNRVINIHFTSIGAMPPEVLLGRGLLGASPGPTIRIFQKNGVAWSIRPGEYFKKWRLCCLWPIPKNGVAWDIPRPDQENIPKKWRICCLWPIPKTMGLLWGHPQARPWEYSKKKWRIYDIWPNNQPTNDTWQGLTFQHELILTQPHQNLTSWLVPEVIKQLREKKALQT